jgi:hypothetical protein
MKIIPGSQYDAKWWKARRGKISASEMGCILTPKTGKLSKAADGYMYRLIGDMLDLEYPRRDDNTSAAMRRGTAMEPESRRWYEFERGLDVQQVSLVLTDDERFAASPDGLVAHDGILECKNPMPATQAEWLLEGVIPAEHLGQAHGLLLVTGRVWLDWLSYCPGFPPLLVHLGPNAYTVALKEALDQFHARYMAALARIRGMDPKNTMEEA